MLLPIENQVLETLIQRYCLQGITSKYTLQLLNTKSDKVSLFAASRKVIQVFCLPKIHSHQTRPLYFIKAMFRWNLFVFCKVYLRYGVVNLMVVVPQGLPSGK